jgi:hypothetical protein
LPCIPLALAGAFRDNTPPPVSYYAYDTEMWGPVEDPDATDVEDEYETYIEDSEVEGEGEGRTFVADDGTHYQQI